MTPSPPFRVAWLGPVEGTERRAVERLKVIRLVRVDESPDAVVVAPGASLWLTTRSMLTSPWRLSRTIVFASRAFSWQTLLGRWSRLAIVQDPIELRWTRRLVRHPRIAVVEGPAAISRRHPRIGFDVAEMCWAPTLAHVVTSNAEVLAAER